MNYNADLITIIGVEKMKNCSITSLKEDTQKSNLEALPNEVLAHIWQYLPKTRQQFRNFASTCKQFYFFAKDERFNKDYLSNDYCHVETSKAVACEKTYAVSDSFLATYYNNKITISNIEDGSVIQTIPYPELKDAYWAAMSFSNNEKLLFVCDAEGKMRAFDISTGQQQAQYQNITLVGQKPYYYNQVIKMIPFGEDVFLAVRHDKYGVADYSRPTVYLYKPNSPQKLEPAALFDIPGEELIDFNLSKDQTSLAILYAKFSNSNQKNIRLAVYNLQTGQVDFDTDLKLRDSSSRITELQSVKILSDNRIVLGGSFGRLYFLQEDDKKLVCRTQQDQTDAMYTLPITQSGKFLALGSVEGVKMFDLMRGKVISTLTSKRPDGILFTNNDNSLIVKSEGEVTIHHFAKTIVEDKNENTNRLRPNF